MSIPRFIAFYLPQYHPIPENNEWWSKGFTEWTNVGKAKALFNGHYQPKVPADLGYYDLRVEDTRIEQAELARKYGIEGFCYWHYWFGNGKRLLERPFNEVLASGKPDFPFCLGWANHTWMRKTWIKDGKDELLISQEYGGLEDYKNHFNEMLPAFKDKRYIRVNGKPFFLIYDPKNIPDPSEFINYWTELANQNGLEGFHFVAPVKSLIEIDEFKKIGFNAFYMDFLSEVTSSLSIRRGYKSNIFKSIYLHLRRTFLGIPKFVSYDVYSSHVIDHMPNIEGVYPSIIPNFDHSPRSGKHGPVLVGESPKKFQFLLSKLIAKIAPSNKENNIFLLRSWNEWGEGNYLEPDSKFGLGFLEALKNVSKLRNRNT